MGAVIVSTATGAFSDVCSCTALPPEAVTLLK